MCGHRNGYWREKNEIGVSSSNSDLVSYLHFRINVLEKCMDLRLSRLDSSVKDYIEFKGIFRHSAFFPK